MIRKPLAAVVLGATGLLTLFAAVARASALKQQEQARALETATPPASPPAPRVPADRELPAGRAPAQLPSSTSAESIPDHPVTLSDAPATPSSAPSSTSAEKPTVRTAKQAAQALYDYVVPLIRAGKGAQLGAKGSPNATVLAAQKDMRGVGADGIYGPKTMARGKELLGREFPARVAKHVPAPHAPATRVEQPKLSPPAVPPPASQPLPQSAPPVVVDAPGRAPQRAAEDLLSYVTPMLKAGKGSQLGLKGKPNPTVQAAQYDMGKISADGIYGLATRNRGKELLGKTFPARA